MASVVQWSIDQLWNQLQGLKNRITAVGAALNADKLELQAAFTATRSQPEPLGSQNRALLTPLIHRNSELRLTYLAPIRDKFNQAATMASNALKGAGYTTPTLSGLGAAFVLAPAAAVAIVIVALAAVATVELLTRTQRTRSATAAAIIRDQRTTAEQKAALLKAYEQEMQKEKDTAPPPPGLDLGWLVPALGLVALIMLGPQLMGMLPRRRAAA